MPILFPVLNAPAESDQQPSPHVHTLSHIGYEAGRKEGGPKDYPRLAEPDQGGNLAGEKRGDSSLGSEVQYQQLLGEGRERGWEDVEGEERGGEGTAHHQMYLKLSGFGLGKQGL